MGEKDRILNSLGLRATLSGASYGDQWFASSGDWIEVHSPTSGEALSTFGTEKEVQATMEQTFLFFKSNFGEAKTEVPASNLSTV